MTKETDARIEALENRVETLERMVVLLMAPMPIWIGYDQEDERYQEAWYKDMHERYEIRTKGLRD